MFISYIIYSFRIFSRYFKMLRESQSLDDARLKEIQFRKLKEEIEFAWNKIPFYRKYWEEKGFNPIQFKTVDDISKIPFTDKNTIREHLNEILDPDYPKERLSLITTGGTTGMPMKFYIDNFFARGKEMAFQIFKSYFYWGYKYFLDKVVILRGFTIDEELIKKNIYWQRSKRDNGLIFSSFHITENNYHLYLNKIRSYRPKYIKAYPSSIVAFCTLMKRHKDFGIEGLKAVICSSESIYDSHRKLIKETLGVEILSFYGHSEKSVCAFQQGDKMYFEPLYGYTEFLTPEKDKPCKEGDIAQVVVTSLDNKYFPFIRYKTNDLVEVANLNNKTAKRIIGRSQEFIYNKNSDKIIFTCHDIALWDINGIEAYQYIQNEIGELTLLLKVNDDFNKINIPKIEKESAAFFYNIDVKVELTKKINKTKSGKFRYLIQNIDI